MTPNNDTTIPVGLCQCGCGGKTAIAVKDWPDFGHVKGQPKRYLRGHNARIPATCDWLEEDRGFRTPCHIWQRGKTQGYGNAYSNGATRPVLAHRVAYEAANGPIPVGLQIDHLCRQRDCVNPAHLEAVTNQVNSQRGARTRITPEDVQIIRSLKGKMSGPKVAALFGVGCGSIYYIWLGKGWRNIAGAPEEHPQPVPRKKLSPDDVRQIRQMQGTHTSYVLAKMFGVRHTTICNIWRNETWRDLT